MRGPLFSILLLLAPAGASEPWGEPVESQWVVQAQLTPGRSALIAAELSARVTELVGEEGDAFVAQQALVQFDDSLARSQVDRAAAALKAARYSLQSNERLLELNAIGQLELELSRAEVDKALAELTYAEAILAKHTIRAPFSGRVAELRIRADEFAQAGQGLLEIIDDSVPRIEFLAPSSWLSWLAPGQAFELRLDETGRAYPATVEGLGASVEPVSRSIKVRAAFAVADPAVIVGMSGTAHFPAR